MNEIYTFQVIVDVKDTDNLCYAQLLLADTLAQISNSYNIEDPNKTHRLSPIRAAASKMYEFTKTVANHGACRGFSVDMVRCTAEARCNQCLSCEARDILDDIKGSEK